MTHLQLDYLWTAVTNVGGVIGVFALIANSLAFLYLLFVPKRHAIVIYLFSLVFGLMSLLGCLNFLAGAQERYDIYFPLWIIGIHFMTVLYILTAALGFLRVYLKAGKVPS